MIIYVLIPVRCISAFVRTWKLKWAIFVLLPSPVLTRNLRTQSGVTVKKSAGWISQLVDFYL
jgi:hypothetical protein